MNKVFPFSLLLFISILGSCSSCKQKVLTDQEQLEQARKDSMLNNIYVGDTGSSYRGVHDPSLENYTVPVEKVSIDDHEDPTEVNIIRDQESGSPNNGNGSSDSFKK